MGPVASCRFLGWLMEQRIVPHIPVRDASERDDGTLSRSDFRWDRRRGVYICPNGKVLHTTGTVHEGNTLRYRASKFDCEVCPLKMQCCPNSPTRQVPRDVHEHARDVTRRLMRTKAFLKSRDERKRVEMRFAHLKVHHGFERMRLRGLSGARDEFVLAAIVQNLKTLALRILGPTPDRRRTAFA
jgi:Transposase DDE domain